MKIQHKRSNQLDGGEAKAPLVEYMEYGELAVNFNTEDPAIFVKVSDGVDTNNDEVIRIAGLGSISGGVPDGPSSERPDGPSLGDLYFDTDLNLLLYWNGDSWQPVGKDNVAIISETAPNPQTENLPEGTFWWDSSEDSGRLFVLYNDPTDENELLWVEASPGGGGGSKAVVSETAPPPSAYIEGDMWWNCSSDSGQLFILYDDPVDNGGGGKTWVAAAPSSGLSTSNLQEVTDAGNNTTNDIKTSGDIQSTSQNGGPLAGFRNHIINGDFRVWQRGEGPAQVASPIGSYYLADRFAARGDVESGGTPTQGLFVDGNINKYRYTATGLTSAAYVLQRIEAANCRHLAGKQVTISCYASHQPAFNFNWLNSSDVGQGLGIVSGTQVPGEPNRWFATYDIPDNQIGSAPEKEGFRCFIIFNNNQDPLVDGVYDVWNIQLEPGPVATPFEHRPIGTELALCQRYFIFSDDYSTFYPAPASGGLYNIYFPNTMRAEPTMSFDNPADIGTVVSGKMQFFFNTFANASPYYAAYAADAEL